MMLLLLLLCACGRAENGQTAMQEAIDFRAALLQAGACSYVGQICAQVGEEVYPFTLRCGCTAEQAEVCVLEPESIADITATVSVDNGTITYADMCIAFGEMADGTVTPLSAPAVLYACWTGEAITAAGMDGDAIRITYEKGYDSQCLTVDTWLNSENHLPFYAEICYNQACIIQMNLTDFAFVSE